MIEGISKVAGKALSATGESVLSNEIIAKATEFVDLKFRDPKLISKIEDELRNKYGEEPVYNDFNAYITENNTISHVFDMFYNIGGTTVLSKRSFSEININAFSKQHTQCSPYELSIVKECFDFIYDEIFAKIVVLSAHTDAGKLQLSGAIWADQSHKEHETINRKLDLLLAQTSQIPFQQKEVTTSIKDDIGLASDSINAFLKKIDSVGTVNNPVSNDLEAITKYQELLGEIAISLRGENEKQVDMVFCSLECHIAIRFSNLGNAEKAFEWLGKIPVVAAENSKLYHFVRSVIIVNYGIEEQYSDAEYSIRRALEIDDNYHRAFLVGQYLLALRKDASFENIIDALNSRFCSIISENKDKDLIADYYSYLSFICREFKEYDLADKAIVNAKSYGYDPLVADYNLGLTYYNKATDGLLRNKRIFCANVDTTLLRQIITIFEKWLLDEKQNDIPMFIKSRMVGIYASSCGLLGIKHRLSSIKEYVNLPDLEYEALRTVILGYCGDIDEEILSLLTADDRLYATIINGLNNDKYCDIQSLLSKINDEDAKEISEPTLYLILQASIANRDHKTYQRFRALIHNVDAIGLIECVDAYALEQNGSTENAKAIVDKYAVTSIEYGLLRNILSFYVRNNYYESAESLFVRILELFLENKLYIDDELDFFRYAITYLIEHQSMNAQKFVDSLDMNCSEAWQLKASFFHSINDVKNLLITLEWLCENVFEYRFGFNKILCLIQLMRYENALDEAKRLLETIHENNTKDMTNVIWLISNIFLLMDMNADSIEWAKKAHELTIDIPNDRSHQAYFARTMRTGKIDDSFGTILDYKKTHPVIVSEWIKEFQLPENVSGEDLINMLDAATGQSHDEYEKSEQQFTAFYKANSWCPNALIVKHYNNDFACLFEFASKYKLRVTHGAWDALQKEVKLIKEHIFVDALTLVVLQHYGCLNALKKIPNIHMCYSTIEHLQMNYQMWSNAGYVQEILAWIKNATNIVLEPDGYATASSISELFSGEYLITCRVAAQKGIPLLTVEPSIAVIAACEEQKNFINLQTISIVSLCYATMSKDSRMLGNMLFNLLANCSFINFTAETIYEQIKTSGFVIEAESLSRFFICNSSCDMISFEKVYISTIVLLMLDHRDAAIQFAELVLNNAFVIWRRGYHDRDMAKRFDAIDSRRKSTAVTLYIIYLIYHIECIFIDADCEALQNKCTELKQKIVDEYGVEFFEEIKASIFDNCE